MTSGANTLVECVSPCSRKFNNYAINCMKKCTTSYNSCYTHNDGDTMLLCDRQDLVDIVVNSIEMFPESASVVHCAMKCLGAMAKITKKECTNCCATITQARSIIRYIHVSYFPLAITAFKHYTDVVVREEILQSLLSTINYVTVGKPATIIIQLIFPLVMKDVAMAESPCSENYLMCAYNLMNNCIIWCTMDKLYKKLTLDIEIEGKLRAIWHLKSKKVCENHPTSNRDVATNSDLKPAKKRKLSSTVCVNPYLHLQGTSTVFS